LENTTKISVQLPPSLSADRWGAQWSIQGVVLRFGNDIMGVAIPLDPRAAAHLATELSRCVQHYEQVYGTLWSEDHVQRSVDTEIGLQWKESGSKNHYAKSLYQWVKNLPLTGFERSFKMSHQQLNADRFLLGVSAPKINSVDVRFIANQMGFPHSWLPDLQRQLHKAVFVHFGFEQSAQHSVYKLYLEFAQYTLPDCPLYLGYKWDAENSQVRSVSSYAQVLGLSLEDMVNRVHAVYGDTHVAHIAQDIVTLAASHSTTHDMLFVEVRDDITSRVSFDINLYSTGLKVEAIWSELVHLCTYLDIKTSDFTQLQSAVRDQVVGHVSGGTDHHGKPFLTVYHALAA
jgi:hypothetical protein